MATTTATRTRFTMADCCSVLVEPIAEDHAAEVAKGFAALADPVRLRLFSMIASAGTCCSCDLIEPIGRSQPTVSHHTKVLADAGLIVGEKAGRWVNWSVVPDRVARLRAALAQ
jgi:ArsR family transcriptional regulator